MKVPATFLRIVRFVNKEAIVEWCEVQSRYKPDTPEGTVSYRFIDLMVNPIRRTPSSSQSVYRKGWLNVSGITYLTGSVFTIEEAQQKFVGDVHLVQIANDPRRPKVTHVRLQDNGFFVALMWNDSVIVDGVQIYPAPAG